MTIIVAAQYDRGSLVGYDTANLKKVDAGYEHAGSVHKFRQIGETGIGMGLSGLADPDYFADLERTLSETEDPVQGIKQFLISISVESADLMFLPHLFREFIFASAGSIRSGDNHYNYRTSEKDCVGIGFGFYKGVDDFLKAEFKPDMHLESAEDMVRGAIDLSKQLNAQDEKSRQGYIIRGLGLMRIEPGVFEVLEFSED